MTFANFVEAQRFIVTELCWLSVNTTNHDMGDAAICMAANLLGRSRSEPYIEYEVGDYLYYISRDCEPTG